MSDISQKKQENLSEYQSFAFHPYNILLFLLLFAVTALFFSLSAALVYTRIQNQLPPIKLPNIFILNTLILIASSGTMIKAKQAYKEDNTGKYQNYLLATIMLSILFMVAQFIGWRTLFMEDIYLHTGNSAAYLYIISGLHFAHVIAGLPFLITFLRKAYSHMKEPVSVLVYFSDPEKRLWLRLLTIYWHFLDIMWIYLVIFFWVNYLFK